MKPLVATVALVALTVGPAWSATDPPDARVNPVSGRIETVDATPGTGGLDIRHAMAADGGAKAVVFLVTTDPRDDRAPRIAIGPTGDSWVVWWREGTAGTVLARRRSAETGTWSDERVLSATGDNARDPEIVHDGTRPWAAFEAETAELGRGIVVGAIHDEPDPFGRTWLATTSFTGDLDVRIHAEAGNLWVTWIDGTATVGWSEYSRALGAWSPVVREPAGDGVDGARQRIRAAVLGN